VGVRTALTLAILVAVWPDARAAADEATSRPPVLSPLLAGVDGAPTATREAWEVRRAVLKKRWLDFLGGMPEKRAPLEGRILETEDLERFVRKRVEYRIEEGVTTMGYLLVPKGGKGKLPAVAVFHQTVATAARQPAGVDLSNPELAIGVQLAERGYVVLCPTCFIFEEGAGYGDHVKRMKERHPGWTGMARMTFDTIRAADYLESLPEVDRDRIGCIGHSLGAKEALYAAAFDERYRAAVFSEGGIGLRFSNWEAPWYLGERIQEPGFAMEHHEVLSLIAPRAFLLLGGGSADGERSRVFVDAARPVWKLLGKEGDLGFLDHGEGHRYPPKARAAAEEFLDRRLKASK
jgi:pimeloyl-ACP methyl ester carboxylesterase